ncbi:hypothetical protein Chor_003329 [Crotalus horridus]
MSSIVFLQPQRTFRAVLCTELKKPLVVRDVPSALLQSHEVRVHVCSCGVNFADILACQGLYQHHPPLPFIPEDDGGDCVIGVTNGKALAEECIADSKLLWKIPQGVPYEEAAALPVSYGTAILALKHRAQTQPGKKDKKTENATRPIILDSIQM